MITNKTNETFLEIYKFVLMSWMVHRCNSPSWIKSCGFISKIIAKTEIEYNLERWALIEPDEANVSK